LLLPDPPKADSPGAIELAEDLANRLRRLELIRRGAEALINRTRLGRDVFSRGAPEGVATQNSVVYEASLYDLLSAYALQAQKHARARVRMEARQVWSLAEAKEALARLVGEAASGEWDTLDSWISSFCPDQKMRRSARASAFSASLEMVREGQIELRQDGAFAPIYIRARSAAADEDRAA